MFSACILRLFFNLDWENFPSKNKTWCRKVSRIVYYIHTHTQHIHTSSWGILNVPSELLTKCLHYESCIYKLKNFSFCSFNKHLRFTYIFSFYTKTAHIQPTVAAARRQKLVYSCLFPTLYVTVKWYLLVLMLCVYVCYNVLRSKVLHVFHMQHLLAKKLHQI